MIGADFLGCDSDESVTWYVMSCQSCGCNLNGIPRCHDCGSAQVIPEGAKVGDVIDYGETRVVIAPPRTGMSYLPKLQGPPTLEETEPWPGIENWPSNL